MNLLLICFSYKEDSEFDHDDNIIIIMIRRKYLIKNYLMKINYHTIKFNCVYTCEIVYQVSQ